MPIERQPRARTVLRGLAFAAAMIAVPAFAQDDAPAAKPGRPWTDPPAHGAAPTDGSASAAPARIGPRAETLAAAPKRASHPSRPAPKVRTASRPVRAKLAARRPDERPRRIRAAASRPPTVAMRDRRMVILRPVPADLYAPPPPYGGRVVMMRPEPGFLGGFEDDRARRMRLAREAGYVLIRSRTYLLPDGRRLRSFRPEDADD